MVTKFFSFFKPKKINNISVSFIVGTGRSGTTMLAQILNAHSKVCIPTELQFLFEYSNNGKKLYDLHQLGELKKWNSQDFIDNLPSMCPHRLEKILNYKKFFKNYKYPVMDVAKLVYDLYLFIATQKNKSIFLEQTPWYGQRLEIIKELFPNAKIIHILRDGRDVSLSFAKTPWWFDDPIQNLDRWCEEVGKISTDLKKHFQNENYIEIKYEDLVNEPQIHLNKVCQLLNIEFEEDMLNPKNLIHYTQFSKNFDKTKFSKAYNKWRTTTDKAIFSDSVYAWKKNPDIFYDISQKNKDTLQYYGYEVK